SVSKEIRSGTTGRADHSAKGKHGAEPGPHLRLLSSSECSSCRVGINGDPRLARFRVRVSVHLYGSAHDLSRGDGPARDLVPAANRWPCDRVDRLRGDRRANLRGVLAVGVNGPSLVYGVQFVV